MANEIITTNEKPKFDPNNISVTLLDRTKGEGQINDMTTAYIDSNTKALDAKKTAALARIKAEEEKIKPFFDEQRVTLGGQAQQAKNQFARFLASRGLGKGGGARQAEISYNGALQSGVSELANKESDRQAEIERLREQANSGYDTDLAQMVALANAQKMDKLFSYGQYGDTYDVNARNTATTNAYNRYTTENADWIAEQERIYRAGKDKQDQTNWDKLFDQTADQNKITNSNNEATNTGFYKNKNGELTPTLTKLEFDELIRQNKQKEIADKRDIVIKSLSDRGYSLPLYGVEDISDADRQFITEMLPLTNGGYAGVGQLLQKTNPAMARKAMAISQELLAQDPALLQKYGAGYRTDDSKSTGAQIEQSGALTENYKASTETEKAKKIGLDIANEFSRIDLSTYSEKTQLAMKTAKQLYEKGEIDLARSVIELGYVEPKLKKELLLIDSNIGQNNASSYAVKKNADTNARSQNWQESPSNSANQKEPKEYKPTENEDYGRYFGSLKNKSFPEAYSLLNNINYSAGVKQLLGEDGYTQLYNAVLGEGIDKGWETSQGSGIHASYKTIPKISR